MDDGLAGVLSAGVAAALPAVAGALPAGAADVAGAALEPGRAGIDVVGEGIVDAAFVELCEGNGFGSSCGGGCSPLLGWLHPVSDIASKTAPAMQTYFMKRPSG